MSHLPRKQHSIRILKPKAGTLPGTAGKLKAGKLRSGEAGDWHRDQQLTLAAMHQGVPFEGEKLFTELEQDGEAFIDLEGSLFPRDFWLDLLYSKLCAPPEPDEPETAENETRPEFRARFAELDRVKLVRVANRKGDEWRVRVILGEEKHGPFEVWSKWDSLFELSGFFDDWQLFCLQWLIHRMGITAEDLRRGVGTHIPSCYEKWG